MEKGKPDVNLAKEVNNIVDFLFFLLLNFFFNKKDGTTPLYIAADKGYEQIVQLLLEKGNPNVDLADPVFSYSLFFLITLSL